MECCSEAAPKRESAPVLSGSHQMEEVNEEHGGDEGLLSEAKTDKGKLTKASVKARLKEIKHDKERYLFEHGLKPLSSVKDMIGSQATKGMHVLSKFAPKIKRCGVWTGAAGLTVIEGYPSGCKRSATIKDLRRRFNSFGHADLDDALTCSLLAYLFAARPETLAPSPKKTPTSEGWIWLPKNGFPKKIEIIDRGNL